MKILLVLLLSSLNAFAYNPTVTLEYNVKTKAKGTDIVFVIDNSGSMTDNQNKLANLRDKFIPALKKVNYKITAISTDVLDNFNYGVVRSSMQDAQDQFKWMIQRFNNNGSADEKSFDALLRFNKSMQAKRFYRKNTTKEIIFFSDEEEQSSSTVNETISNFKGLFTASAIIPFKNSECTLNNSQFARFNQIVQNTNGSVFDICLEEQALGEQIEIMASEIVKRINKYKKPLMPISKIKFNELVRWKSIRVSYGSQIIAKGLRDTGWVFDESENTLYFGNQIKLDPKQPANTKLKIRYIRY